ncbi:hypothetical protein MVEN_01916400 [Mycena venus]|uniref:C2 domain-containing protein n=1 Tax=Mycena venus TaxID=2733690 RepID=A0A8H7CL56_9AGAR|nr:hypothetical protein MVEN_01916400 [Mycena venus]
MPVNSPFSRFCNASTGPQLAHTENAIGALKIIIQSAHIDGSSCWRWRRPNPSVAIRVNSTKVKTDTQSATYDPTWMEQTLYLLVASPKEEIRMRVYDHHEHRRLLGEASFDMTRLIESGMELNAQLPFLKRRKRRGDLLCSLFYFPISRSLETDVGIVHLTVHRAEDLHRIEGRSSRSCLVVMPIARVRLAWDTPSIHVTPPGKMIDKGLALWESMHEFLCFNKSSCVVYVDVLDPHLEDLALGHVCLGLTDLIEATIAKRGPWPLSGSAAGKLFVSAEWKPLNLKPNI